MIAIRKTFFWVLIIFSLIASCAVSPISINDPAEKISNQDEQKFSPEIATDQVPTSVYLPTIQKEFPLQTIFGVQMSRIASSNEIDRINELGITWTRKDLFWTQVEQVEGQYDWSVLTEFEQDLINNSSRYINVILVVNKTPQWARLYQNSECGPIKREKFDAFGKFMASVVTRYSKPPFNILYYEIWNEPDVDPALFNYSGNSIGCWGDNNDDYYGGGYYADMLKVIYPYVKAANPNAQVIIGGLLLDCDPRGYTSPCQKIGNNSKPAKFLEGILRNGGKNYFDGISFHAYDQYSGSVGQYSIKNWDSYWNTTGPTIFAKTNFIKEVLNTYDASNKFLMNTESAVLCETCESDTAYKLTKAYYIPQVYSYAIFLGLKANLWYSSIGWRNSGLITTDGEPIQPAYQSYQHTRETFLNARFVSELSLGNGIQGFEFSRDNILLWVVWSKDGNLHPIRLPTTPLRITSSLGEIIQSSENVDVTIKPIFIEFLK